MLDQLILNSSWVWIVLVLFCLEALTQLAKVIAPNNYTKRVIAGKTKLHDSWSRFLAVFSLAFCLFIIAYILEWIH